MPPLAQLPVTSILGAAALYLFAHFLRSVRLALLGVRLARISGRTTVLLHFVTAPGALILPFKLGELLRLHQLWQLGDDFAAAVLVVLSERFFDGLMVLCLLAIAYHTGATLDGGAWVVSAATALAVVVALIVLFLGPGTFTALQLHIIRHYAHRFPVNALSRVDLLRRQTTEAGRLMRERGGLLTLLSLAIWATEVAAASWIASAGRVDGALPDRPLAGVRLAVDGIFMQSASEAGNAALGIWMVTTVSVLVLVWPVALWRYLGRAPLEPARINSIRQDRIRHEAVNCHRP